MAVPVSCQLNRLTPEFLHFALGICLRPLRGVWPFLAGDRPEAPLRLPGGQFLVAPLVRAAAIFRYKASFVNYVIGTWRLQRHRLALRLTAYRTLKFTRTQCYTEIVLKNITITVSEEAALWARRKAAEENTSVSKLVGQMLEDQMRRSDEYRRAFQRWKRIGNIEGIGAASRLSREETHARR